jgi:hypothetical protein
MTKVTKLTNGNISNSAAQLVGKPLLCSIRYWVTLNQIGSHIVKIAVVHSDFF